MNFSEIIDWHAPPNFSALLRKLLVGILYNLHLHHTIKIALSSPIPDLLLPER